MDNHTDPMAMPGMRDMFVPKSLGTKPPSANWTPERCHRASSAAQWSRIEKKTVKTHFIKVIFAYIS